MQWCRVRAAPVSTPAQDLHASGCLDGLHPGDHFEIQWRKNKDFPYGMHHHALCCRIFLLGTDAQYDDNARSNWRGRVVALG